MTNIKLGSSLAALVVLALSAPALARDEPVSVAVSYADLDLGTAAGVAQLDRRVRRAAAAICLRERHHNLTTAYLPEPTCLRSAVASGRLEVAAAVARFRDPARSPRRLMISVR